jgi:hypothetical protein
MVINEIVETTTVYVHYISVTNNYSNYVFRGGREEAGGMEILIVLHLVLFVLMRMLFTYGSIFDVKS